MQKGSKKSPVTKESLANEMRLNQSRALIKDKFYPALQEATESVDEAQMLMQAAVSLIMEEAMETLRTTKIKDIRSRLVSKLAPNDERLLQIEKLIDVFKDSSLFETRGHFESMRAVINQMQQDEMRSRKLDTFIPNWDRYLHGK